jgi:hypothetical protein
MEEHENNEFKFVNCMNAYTICLSAASKNALSTISFMQNKMWGLWILEDKDRSNYGL